MFSMSTQTAQALKDLADAKALMASALQRLSGDIPAGHAACKAMLIEAVSEDVAREQIHCAHSLRATGAHKLTQDSLQNITEAGLDPTMEQLEAAEGRTTTGRTHFKDAKGLMVHWLGIALGTASTRLVQADCLIGGVDDAGQPIAAWLPELAEEFEGRNLDPRLVASTALKLHSARKDLGEGTAGEAKKQELQDQATAFLRAEPKTARKHINDLISQIKSGQRPMKALLDEIGIFKRGMRKGLVEYLLRVLPSQDAYVQAFFTRLGNPATAAGNRQGLKDAEAQFTGQEASDWDDGETKPEWAREDADTEQELSDSKENRATGQGEPGQWEDLKPERRRLVGFMALLMTDRKPTGSQPEEIPGLARVQVSIILNWEKMQQQASSFAVTSAGTPLSPGETRAALCNAGIYPLVLNSKSLPLDLGRTQRFFSKAQGRAIRAAYRGCSYPGCSMPAEQCEIDHLDPWEKGGRTDIKSADLNCLIHHPARHCGLFHAVKVPGSRPMVLLPPELDPEQKLRFNTYFMTPDEASAANTLAEEATRQWRAGLIEVEIVEP